MSNTNDDTSQDKVTSMAPRRRRRPATAPDGPAPVGNLPAPEAVTAAKFKRHKLKGFGKGNQSAAGKGGRTREEKKLYKARMDGLVEQAPEDWKEILRSAMMAGDPANMMTRLMKNNPLAAAQLAKALIDMEGKGLIDRPPPRPVVIQTRFPGVGASQEEFDQYAVAEENVRLKKAIEKFKKAQAAPVSAKQAQFTTGKDVGVDVVLSGGKQDWEDF
ncbi:MAG TPA: hypothetical protein VNA25_04080 [Phycisphaerae bacterium]|nr:hypothetical protein [Phycisphaerae bacterium]